MSINEKAWYMRRIAKDIKRGNTDKTVLGYLEIQQDDEPCFTADTRQGVAIGYIAKPTEKSA